MTLPLSPVIGEVEAVRASLCANMHISVQVDPSSSSLLRPIGSEWLPATPSFGSCGQMDAVGDYLLLSIADKETMIPPPPAFRSGVDQTMPAANTLFEMWELDLHSISTTSPSSFPLPETDVEDRREQARVPPPLFFPCFVCVCVC